METRPAPSKIKIYETLFTSLTIQPVLLELEGDTSTDSFIIALRRFLSRGGKPNTISCDNDSNFVGAQ